MKKSCVNCAFCMRCKNYWITFPPMINKEPFWENNKDNLTGSDIQKIYANDFSFLGEEKLKQQEWEQEYKSRLNAKIEQENQLREKLLQGSEFDKFKANFIGMNLLETNSFSLREELGMPEYPSAPDEDYLACWHEQWSTQTNPDILKNIVKHKCRFYYPISRKNTKTFESCYREQQDMKANTTKNIALWTLLVTICGILLALIQIFKWV